MNFNFEKTQRLISFLNACDALLTSNKDSHEDFTMKVAITNLQLMHLNGEDITEFPDEELTKTIKTNPIPSVKEIENEFYSNFTRIEEAPFVFRVFSSLWENALIKSSLNQVYHTNQLLNFIGWNTLIIKNDIEKLLDNLSQITKEKNQNIYKQDDIATSMQSFKGPKGNDSITRFNSQVIDKVYNRCNSKLWNSILKQDFETMLNSGEITLEIKNGNKQRTSALFNRLGMLITDNARWIKSVEQSLDIDRLSKTLRLDDVNSNPNKDFNDFLDEIYQL